MKTTCPHCSVHIDIDSGTHAALQGQTHFQCPDCNGLVSVPRLSAQPQPWPSPAPAAILAHARRGLNRNLLITGAVVTLSLGGTSARAQEGPPEWGATGYRRYLLR